MFRKILMAAAMALAVSAVPAMAAKVTPAGEPIIAEWTGEGRTTTRPFHVDGPWELQWTLTDIPSMPGTAIFHTYLQKAGGAAGDFSVIGNSNMPGTGSSYVDKGGDYYLQVNAIGRWHIQVVLVHTPNS
jgi:hypothetical protein